MPEILFLIRVYDGHIECCEAEERCECENDWAKRKLKLVIRVEGMRSVRRRKKIYDNLVPPSEVGFDKKSVKFRVWREK